MTTTNGTSQPVVRCVGSESSNQLHRLHAFNGETGQVLFGGGGPDEQMTVRHLQTPIAVDGRILVAGDDRFYAFRTQSEAPGAEAGMIPLALGWPF